MNLSWLKLKKFALILLSGLVLTACGGTDTAEAPSEKGQVPVTQEVEAQKTVTFKIVTADTVLAERELEFEEGDTVLETLEKHFDVEATDGFVSSIEGATQSKDDQLYWMYYVNGEMADVGAADYQLSSGDLVEWRLEDFSE